METEITNFVHRLQQELDTFKNDAEVLNRIIKRHEEVINALSNLIDEPKREILPRKRTIEHKTMEDDSQPRKKRSIRLPLMTPDFKQKLIDVLQQTIRNHDESLIKYSKRIYEILQQRYDSEFTLSQEQLRNQITNHYQHYVPKSR